MKIGYAGTLHSDPRPQKSYAVLFEALVTAFYSANQSQHY